MGFLGFGTPKAGERGLTYIQCNRCGHLHEVETFYNFNMGQWETLSIPSTCFNCGGKL